MPRPGKARHARAGASPCHPILDLDRHIATKVAVFANRLQRSASRFYRKHYNIGIVEWRLVMYIGQVGKTRANRICSETDLDKGAVSRSLGLLQRTGIVSVEEDGADSRRNNVALTAKGRALHDELVPLALERQRELVSDLTQAEVQILIHLIDRLQAQVVDGNLRGGAPASKVVLRAPSSPKGTPRRSKARRVAARSR